MTLGKKIYTLRTERGMTQEQLAERLGVSRQSVSKYEYNQSTPELEKIKLLAEIFEVTPDDLINDKIDLPKTETDETVSGKNESMDAAMDAKADSSDSSGTDETEKNSPSLLSAIEELTKKTDSLQAQYDHLNKTFKTALIIVGIGIFSTVVILVTADIYQSSLISALQNNQNENVTTYIPDYEETLIDQTFSSYEYGAKNLNYNKTDNTVDYSISCKPISYSDGTTISALLTFENGKLYDGILSESNGTFSGTITLPLTADDFSLSLLIDNHGEKQNIDIDESQNLLDDLDWEPSVDIVSANTTYGKNNMTTLFGEMYLQTYEPNDVDTILPFISDIKIAFCMDDSILYEYTLTKEEVKSIQNGYGPCISYQFDLEHEAFEKNIAFYIEYKNSLIGKKLRCENILDSSINFMEGDSVTLDNEHYPFIKMIEGEITDEEPESGYTIMPK